MDTETIGPLTGSLQIPTEQEQAREAKALVTARKQQHGLMPKTVTEFAQLADIWHKSGLAPRGLDTPQKIMVAMMTCADRNLPLSVGLKYIAVVNGSPLLWGDAAVALARASGKVASLRMYYDEERKAGVCETSRRDEVGTDGKPVVHRYAFTEDDAAAAGLLRKAGPWTQGYRKRMQVWRATAWCLRDVYADELLGLSIAQEVADYDGNTLVEVSPGQFEVRAEPKVLQKNPLEAQPVEPIPDKPTYADDPVEFVEWFCATCAEEPDHGKLVNLYRNCAADLATASDEEKTKMRDAYKAALERIKTTSNEEQTV